MERGGEGAGTGVGGERTHGTPGHPPPHVAVASSPPSNVTHLLQFAFCIFIFPDLVFGKILRNLPDFTWDDRE